VLGSRTALLHTDQEFGALHLGFVIESESEETYFALTVNAARSDVMFGISASTVRYRAALISYLSLEN
jgi:hypothetical protein